MSDNIFGERFYGTREPAWHNLGKVFEKALAPTKAVKEIGLDYEVHTYPLFSYPAKGVKVASKRFTILRDPTKDDNQYREFGTASSIYEIVQNTELAKIMDPLAEIWPLETMGALDYGKTVFMVLNVGESDVNGDPIKNYFMLVNSNDGGTATKLVYTPVRVVCQNTLVTGLRKATVSVNVQHITGAKEQLNARVQLIKTARAAIDETTELFRQLATTQIKPAVAEDILSRVYKVPNTPADMSLVDYSEEDLGAVLTQSVADSMYTFNYYSNVAQTNQANALDLYEKLNDEFPKQAGTAWGLFNAVVELSDYRLGGKSPEQSALFGARAMDKKRAFKECVKLIK